MQKLRMLNIVFTSLAILSFVAGFALVTWRPENIWIGLTLLMCATVLMIISLVPQLRVMQIQRDLREARLQNIEDNVAKILAEIEAMKNGESS